METLSEQLLLEHAAFVRALARRLVRDEHQAEDVAQATLLAALEKPPPRRTNVRGWLATVTRNLAAKWRRGEARRTRHERAVPRTGSGGDAGDAVARIELQQLVVAEALALDDKYREVIVLRYFEGLDPIAIARRLGLPTETARTRLRRAVEQLRARLDARHGGDRRAWSVALLPLAGLAKTSSAATGLAVGAVVMSTKSKVIAVAAVLLTAGVSVESVRRMSRSEGPRTKTAAAPRPVTRERVEAEPQQTRTAKPAPRHEHAYQTWGNVPGARVLLRLRYYGGTPDPAPLEQIADADGYAGFDPAPHEEPLHDASVLVSAPGHLGTHMRFEGAITRYKLTTGAITEVAHPEATVTGRVVASDDTPVPGICLNAGHDQAVSDRDGRFELSVFPGDVQIQVNLTTNAWGTGGGSIMNWQAQAGDRNVEIKLYRAILSVVVLDNVGRPFRHAQVTVQRSKSGFGTRSHTFDAGESGTVTATPERDWKVHVTAAAPGYAPAEYEYETHGGPTRHVELTLERPAATGALEVHATDVARRPRKFVLLSLWTRSGAPVDKFLDKRVELDERGRTRLDDIAPGHYRVRVAALPAPQSVSGYGMPQFFDIEVRPREATPVEARLPDGGRVRVTVRNAAGDVAPPGTLELRRADNPYRFFTSFCVEVEGRDWMLMSDHTTAVPLITAAPIEPGRYRVMMKRGGKKVTEGEIAVVAGKTADLELHVND